MAPKIHAQIHEAFFEYRATYKEPFFDLLQFHTKVKAAIFRALGDWSISLSNVTGKQNPANDGEVETNFALPGGKVIFKVGLGSCNLVVSNADWTQVETISKIANASVAAVLETTGVLIDRQLTTIAMHLKPDSGSLRDITSRFVNVDASKLPTGQVKVFGLSIYTESTSWVMDASNFYADSLFLRIGRSFGPAVSFGEIASQLNEEERRFLDLVELEVD